MVGQLMEENIIEDSDVLAEEERIRNLIATHPGTGGEALVAAELTKVYRNFYAVNHLTFGIHPEECFGLLGVNGAGKTTTFRMLTGDTFPSDGNAILSSSSIRTDLKKFQSNLGYCPQFDALIDRLTGREMLTLFARLRGLTGFELEERIDKLIKMTDLSAHADKQTQFYSGGNKRKLSVALSLIGSPPLILLDEPTAGVDPVSRRKIWNILSQARNNTGAAVILTTHSRQEAAVADWYRYRTVACLVTSSSPVPPKTRHVGQRCTLNLSREETSSRWCGIVVRRGGCHLRCDPRHMTMVQNYVVRRQKPSCS
ncbi:ATP-binding cassette sub-family A member 7 [Trichonephila clavipes]|nr:ATP-binding cassette sub-family A member 7 [Trichonephila clavipes]